MAFNSVLLPIKRAARQVLRRQSRVAVDPKAPLAAQFLVEDHKADGVPVLDRRWYYSIETSPGIWTRGHHFPNVGLTREALRNFNPLGKRCLDIGAMDGLVTALLYRRGAKDITAYDRLNFSERIEFLKKSLQIDFTYKWGDTFHDFHLKQLEEPLFDAVIFSGVMYHMIDPLGGLLRTRSLVRDGGIVIVETAAIQDKRPISFFNARGQFYHGDNYFFPSTTLLDYWLRLARLEPLDCYWMEQSRRIGFGKDPLRICIPCRAVPTPLVEPDDVFMANAAKKVDFIELCDLSRCAKEATAPVYYSTRSLPIRPTGGVDLFRTVRTTAAFKPPKSLTQLTLQDTF